LNEPVVTTRNELRIQGLGKRYASTQAAGGELQVLQNIDLVVPEGRFVSIVGASGCGKSTLLRLVLGLDDQYEGRILLDGRPIHGTGPERGIVFQDHRLFPWLTVEQNIALGLRNADLAPHQKRERVAEHVALVGLQGFERSFPHQISGGMAQRVAIARGLVTGRACCCWTSRSARWTRSRGRGCRSSCSASGRLSASPCYWSRTMSTRPSSWAMPSW
jgi:sulfonate transport system ATP-binding protein